jgi:two-component system chemotaxis response regulator CheB
MIERPCPVVMLSTLSTAGAEATLEAFRLGAVDFVAKPGGAVSLRVDAFIPELVEKVRAAASAKPRSSLRLRERVRHRMGSQQGLAARQRRGGAFPRLTGEGVVVVGTSTGGPPALEALLAPLPANFAWPIVIAQHMPASFTGPLAKRLDGLCAISVEEVADSVLLRPGCAYVGRGEKDIVISRSAAGLMAEAVPALAGYPWHPSTDRLVTSAMDHVAAPQLVGILMTGMGNDGAAAMTRLHEGGGKTIAESEETAVVWGMPGELVKADGADWVLPLPKIAEQLQSLVPAYAAYSQAD